MVLIRRDDPITVNGPGVTGPLPDISITSDGSYFYLAMAAVFGAATLAFVFMAKRRPRTHRVFHYILAAITLVAFLSYFCKGSNLGWTSINTQFRRSGRRVRGFDRQIFYARYIDWFITTALILLALLLTAGMPWPTILWVILVDWFMIICGLIGALVASRYKWAFFAFGCAALLYLIYAILIDGRRHANALGTDVGRTYLTCAALTSLVWMLYPIAWGVSEGGNVIAPNSEAIFYAVLDFFSKVVFGALLLWGHRAIEPGRLGLRVRDYDDDPSVIRGLSGHGHHSEKTTAPITGTTAGTTAAHHPHTDTVPGHSTTVV